MSSDVGIVAAQSKDFQDFISNNVHISNFQIWKLIVTELSQLTYSPLYCYSFRWMGGVGLTSFVLLILVLQMLGLILGCIGCCCGGSKDNLPTKRSSAGNCGGILLMA